MTTQTASPLAHLAAAEATLVAAINSAADAMDRLATVNIDVALARLEESVRGVHARLGLALGAVEKKAAEVVETINAVAGHVADALALNVQPAAEEPVPAQIAATTPTEQPIESNAADADSRSQEPRQDVPATEATVTPAEQPGEQQGSGEQGTAVPDTTIAVAACSPVEASVHGTSSAGHGEEGEHPPAAGKRRGRRKS
jgi:hypothetical protein